jgi:fructosamine-3-kinase
MDWKSLEHHLSIELASDFKIDSVKQVSGGDINQAFLLQVGQQSWFIKVNRASLLEMFEAEQAGLNEIAATDTIRVPEPLSCGLVKNHCYLLMENLNLKRGSSVTDRLLARQLAQLHQIKQPYFGWFRENTIGSTTQLNENNESWPKFWCAMRLHFQLQLAANNGFGGRLQSRGEQLCDQLDNFFVDYHPSPALVHGDLWSGNAGVNDQNQPVIYDPACYYADREVDIAMTELFGGFSSDFYAVYNDIYALDSGYETRKTLYNLYHILNHLNLFGSAYLSQAESMIEKQLAEIH